MKAHQIAQWVKEVARDAAASVVVVSRAQKTTITLSLTGEKQQRVYQIPAAMRHIGFVDVAKVMMQLSGGCSEAHHDDAHHLDLPGEQR